MVTLPLPQALEQSSKKAARLQYGLLYEHRIEAPIISLSTRLWVRVSAQVYNDRQDIERLARLIEVFSGFYQQAAMLAPKH